MIELGDINDRQVLYLTHELATVWLKEFPKGNWLLFVITDKHLPETFNEISRCAIDNDVVFVCSTGQHADSFHQAIDDIILIRGVENDYLPQWCILTTADNDLEEAFWFAVNSALGETERITKIVCLDITTTNHTDILKDLIRKMKTGWMPYEN